jgi:hypothetical protein
VHEFDGGGTKLLWLLWHLGVSSLSTSICCTYKYVQCDQKKESAHNFYFVIIFSIFHVDKM